MSSVIALSDGAGGLKLDYNYTTSGSWTMLSTAALAWNNDTGIARNSALVVEIDNGIQGSGSFGDLKLRQLLPVAQTATTVPIKLAGGATLLTTPAVGAFEFDNVCFYQTAVASSRQVVNTEQVQCLSASRTFTNNTSAQAIFNATANGAITLSALTTYEFESVVAASGFSASAHTINIGFGGTAVISSIAYYYEAQAGTTLAGPNADSSGFVAAATATAVIPSSTTTGLLLYMRGVVRIASVGGGTFIPQLTQVTASAAAVVQANSFFRIWPIGSASVTNVGNWS